MNTKRTHLKFGLWGCYLLILTLFLLYAGVFQTVNTTIMCIDMRLLGLEWSYPTHIMFSLQIIFAICQIVTGIIGLRCYLYTPSAKLLRKFSICLFFLQILVICRDITRLHLSISTFTYIHRMLLIAMFAKSWGTYVHEQNPMNINKSFPFIREFLMCKNDWSND